VAAVLIQIFWNFLRNIILMISKFEDGSSPLKTKVTGAKNKSLLTL
jgi:hypothetical protein